MSIRYFMKKKTRHVWRKLFCTCSPSEVKSLALKAETSHRKIFEATTKTFFVTRFESAALTKCICVQPMHICTYIFYMLLCPDHNIKMHPNIYPLYCADYLLLRRSNENKLSIRVRSASSSLRNEALGWSRQWNKVNRLALKVAPRAAVCTCRPVGPRV